MLGYDVVTRNSVFLTAHDQPHELATLQELDITRALKCKPSAGDMIIKKPED